MTLKLVPSLMFGSHVSRNRNASAQTNRHLRLVLIFYGVQETLRSRLSLAPPRARLQSPQAT
jgi:hypothetical protein